MLGRIARASSGLFMRSLTSHLHIHVSPTRSRSLLRSRRGRRTRRQPTSSSSSSFPAYETCSPPSLFSFFLPSRGRGGNEPTANVKPAGRRRGGGLHSTPLCLRRSRSAAGRPCMGMEDKRRMDGWATERTDGRGPRAGGGVGPTNLGTAPARSTGSDLS